jgi:hypothetical protein
MNRLLYLVVFVVSALLLALGLLFLCASSVSAGRAPLAIVLLILGAGGAAWSAFAYRHWAARQPGTLASRITELASQNHGEIAVAQVMAALNLPRDAVAAGLDRLVSDGQCHPEAREGGTVYIFPTLQQHKVVRKCAYCGNTFPVKEPLEKCPNCGGKLEMVKE